jgi:hypothetical protein
MLVALLRWVRDTAQDLLERLDPIAETPTIPPPAPDGHTWSQLELMACADMPAVNHVLARWLSEGLDPVMANIVRHSEELRRFNDVPLTSHRVGLG